MLPRIIFCAIILWLSTAVARADDYAQELATERAERVKRLTAPEGWLSLIGLHFLTLGENTVGRAPENKIVLAAGPARFGTMILAEDGNVRLQVSPGVEALVNGEPVLSVNLGDGRSGRPVSVACGTMSIHVIERGGQRALRVKDSASERRSRFAGIDYFPVDPSWRIEAAWEAFDQPREVPIKNILGQESKALVLGRAVFTRDGHTLALLPLQESPDEPLFFIISDLTSGEETYGAARFLYADPPRDGKVVLDFNRAINPPCAFTPFATCPLPPKENQLPIAVTAGEKDYRGEHK
jgi:uncharacterized protein (DUF1684 family)